MEHRGGCSADNDSGDGAGIMTKIPWALLSSWQKSEGLPEIEPLECGVGMIFLPREENAASKAKEGQCFAINLSCMSSCISF